jgi:large subunit ribosomal protein L15
MQLHLLKPKSKRKERKRIGRGGKRGTYSGRGMKGQGSRAGKKLQPSIRVFVKRYPKKRGYRFNPTKSKPMVVNLSQLESKFENNGVVNPKTLLEVGLVDKIKGRVPEVKILAQGTLTKKLVVENCSVSKSAEEKIKKVGGKVF